METRRTRGRMRLAFVRYESGENHIMYHCPPLAPPPPPSLPPQIWTSVERRQRCLPFIRFFSSYCRQKVFFRRKKFLPAKGRMFILPSMEDSCCPRKKREGKKGKKDIAILLLLGPQLAVPLPPPTHTQQTGISPRSFSAGYSTIGRNVSRSIH